MTAKTSFIYIHDVTNNGPLTFVYFITYANKFPYIYNSFDRN